MCVILKVKKETYESYFGKKVLKDYVIFIKSEGVGKYIWHRIRIEI